MNPERMGGSRFTCKREREGWRLCSAEARFFPLFEEILDGEGLPLS